MPTRFAAALALLAACGLAAAQQLYRWTDASGKVHISDSPPPADAREVQQMKEAPAAPTQAPAAAGGAFSYELQQAMANFPGALYTSSNCEEGCTRARDLLNKRGVPFKEVVVKDQAGIDELKKITGQGGVPAITVGRSVQTGFEQGAYDALLDSAGYPKAGVLPPRSQTAPQPQQAAVKAAPQAEAAPPAGPYSPKPPAKPQAEPPRLYSPIPGKDKPITGPYGKPAEPAPQQAPAQSQ